jgi:predicted DNA-binding protein with PD1-like motif
MHAKVVRQGTERTIGLVFERGEEPIAALERYAQEQALDSSRFAATGALEEVELGYFDRKRQTYRAIAIRERVEVVALVGDIEAHGTRVHAHVVFERRDGSICGGQLLRARVGPTLDLVLIESHATGADASSKPT